jgi:hypothetical protein
MTASVEPSQTACKSPEEPSTEASTADNDVTVRIVATTSTADMFPEQPVDAPATDKNTKEPVSIEVEVTGTSVLPEISMTATEMRY